MIKNIAELRHPVEVVKVVSVRGADNVMTSNDVTVCNCHAAVKDAGSSEYYAAAATQFTDIVNFTIRWREGISPGMVVVYGGRRHSIMQVSRLGHRGDFMVLKTGRKAVASG